MALRKVYTGWVDVSRVYNLISLKQISFTIRFKISSILAWNLANLKRIECTALMNQLVARIILNMSSGNIE